MPALGIQQRGDGAEIQPTLDPTIHVPWCCLHSSWGKGAQGHWGGAGELDSDPPHVLTWCHWAFSRSYYKSSHMTCLCLEFSLSPSAHCSHFNGIPRSLGRSNLCDKDSSPHGQEAFRKPQTSLSHFQVYNCIITALLAPLLYCKLPVVEDENLYWLLWYPQNTWDVLNKYLWNE